MRVTKLWTWPMLVVGLALPGLIDCSDAADAFSGCDELDAGASAVGSLSIDAKVKSFVVATADLQAIAKTMKTDVKTACGNIAVGLGETDTWSTADTDEAVTTACNAASAKIKGILSANANAQASVIVSGGQCSVNADLQATCEGSCKADVSCTEPKLEARCDPGQLSAVCDAECKGSATCQGSATVAATCKGTCEAECTGKCSGACSGTIMGGGCTGTCEGKCDGMATPAGGTAACKGTCEGKCSALSATASCTGKCEASCDGTCTGNCKLEANANIKCGAMVSCKGGCTTTFTAPKCEAELTPPMCMGEASCQASCSGRAEVNATCTKPTVKIVYSASSEDLTKLKTVLEANLPSIWLAAKTQGQLALSAAGKVVGTGQVAVSAAASAGGKAIACTAAAVKGSVQASASVSVSVMASASVSGSAGS